ncbi:MAG: hypothetical protein C0507_25395 [Cyanobacteria bacterium PR.3.49]|nr:hypothetical protein [Cyanobacteria bacterium PR.3.49]
MQLNLNIAAFLPVVAILLSTGSASAQVPITKTMTVTGNHVGPFNVNAHVQGPTQTQKMQQISSNPQQMHNKTGTANCPSALPPATPAATSTPPAASSPTSFAAPPSFGGFPVPPWGSQDHKDGTNISVFPGGTTVTTPPGGTPIITPPGLGEDKTHGAVIARQVRPGGKVVQIYEDGHYSVTKGGATKFSTKPIW